MKASSSPTAPAYRVHTRRLLLRPWNPEDSPALHEAIVRSQTHLAPFLPWARLPRTLDEQLASCRRNRAAFDQGTDLVYAALLREDPRVVVGGTGLHSGAGERALKIGYWIAHDRVRQGFATEMAAAMTRLGFEVEKVMRMEIHMAVPNVASAAVPPKLGYREQAVLPRRLSNAEGGFDDVRVFAMHEEEYARSPAAAFEMEAWDGAGRRLL